MRKRLSFLYLLVCFALFSQTYAQSTFQNIVVGNMGNPNEPSIAISPTDTNKILAATNTDKVFSSLDGGKTLAGEAGYFCLWRFWRPLYYRR